MKARCFICHSKKFVDRHHYDCQYGRLSPETVPLCRRCHKTYHIWDVGAFSPDTTEKALVVENKRREILRSLPPDHPEYHRAEHLGILSPLKLEDVRRSRYWYKKWGITPPRKERVKIKAAAGIPFRILSNPLCGWGWLVEHRRDHTHEEIEALGIVICYEDKRLPLVSVSEKKGTVKKVMRKISCHG